MQFQKNVKTWVDTPGSSLIFLSRAGFAYARTDRELPMLDRKPTDSMLQEKIFTAK
jgi:hypothetical protein